MSEEKKAVEPDESGEIRNQRSVSIESMKHDDTTVYVVSVIDGDGPGAASLSFGCGPSLYEAERLAAKLVKVAWITCENCDSGEDDSECIAAGGFHVGDVVKLTSSGEQGRIVSFPEHPSFGTVAAVDFGKDKHEDKTPCWIELKNLEMVQREETKKKPS